MNHEAEKLLYRRQYIIAPEKISIKGKFKIITVNRNYLLYRHEDLPLTITSDKNRSLYLLGDIYSYKNPEYNNQQILDILFDFDFENCIEATFAYAGRFVLIYVEDEKIRIFHDATASRKLYYTTQHHSVWCASQPHLLAEILKIRHTDNKEIREYYSSVLFLKREKAGIADLTIYDTIFQLMPNNYLDLSAKKAIRYWPKEAGDEISLREAALFCSGMLKGFLKSAGNRYKLMIPVTAGIDSRLLLAASKEIRHDVFYYINKEKQMTYDCNDIKIPKRLLERNGIRFNILENFGEDFDEHFSDAYKMNVEFYNEKYLPIIYNYHKNFSNYLNCPGSFNGVAKDYFNIFYIPVNGKILSRVYYLDKYQFVEEKYSKWLDEIKEIIGYNHDRILELFYWEERMGNWGTQIQTNKDIAQEDFIPFNSRLYITRLLAINNKYRRYPEYEFSREMIRILWPELLKEPVNPSFKAKMTVILKRLKLYKIFKKYSEIRKYKDII